MLLNRVDKKQNAFTLIELLVAIVISLLLLGGIFYFMSETILGISRSSTQAAFLKDFYSFTTVLDTWDLDIIHDYDGTGFDVWLLTSLDRTNGIIIGIIDQDTLKLSPYGMLNIYHNSMLGYRSVSALEIENIDADPSVVYDYDFFGDKVFSRFNIRDFQMVSYNTGSTIEMILDISPVYNTSFTWQDWSSVPQDEIFTYSLVF